MKYYTELIPLPLAEKLKEKGMPIEMQPLYAPEAPNARGIVKAGVGLMCPSYAEVFDWLMSEKDIYIRLTPSWDSPSDAHLNYEYRLTEEIVPFKEHMDNVSYSWHGAANAAIEKALTLI